MKSCFLRFFPSASLGLILAASEAVAGCGGDVVGVRGESISPGTEEQPNPGPAMSPAPDDCAITGCVGQTSPQQTSSTSRPATALVAPSSCPADFNAGPLSTNTTVPNGLVFPGPWPGFDTGLPTGGPAMQTIFASAGAVEVSGAVATDGNVVFWIQDTPTESDQIVSCPLTGCPDNKPAVFWPASSWGGAGGLVLAGGRLYFQQANIYSDGPVTGPIVSCPVAGCGAEPSTFVGSVKDSSQEPPLASDASDLYWVDGSSIYACALGETCASPRLVTTMAGKAYLSALTVAAPSLLWVDGFANDVLTVPTAGGAARTLCHLPGTPDGWVASVGGYAYASISVETTHGGIYRCSTAGDGPATRYLDDPNGAEQIATDGSSLFWLASVLDPNGDEWPYVARCAPGAECSGLTNVGGVFSQPNENTGFVLSGDSVYGAGASVVRTAYCGGE